MYLDNRAAERLDKAIFLIFYYFIIILFLRVFYFVSSLYLYMLWDIYRYFLLFRMSESLQNLRCFCFIRACMFWCVL